MKKEKTKIFRIVNSESIMLYNKVTSSDRLYEMETYPLYKNKLFLRKYTDNNRVNYKITYIDPEHYIFFNTDGIRWANTINMHHMISDKDTDVSVNIRHFGWLLFKFSDDILKSIWHNGYKIYDIEIDEYGHVNLIRNLYYNGSVTLNYNKFCYINGKIIINCKKLTGRPLIDIDTDINDMPTERVDIYNDFTDLIYQSINNGNITRSIDTKDGNKIETIMNALNNKMDKIIYYYDNGVLKEDTTGKEYEIITDNDFKNKNCPQINIKCM